MGRQPFQVLVQGHLAHLYKVLLLHDLRHRGNDGSVRFSSCRIAWLGTQTTKGKTGKLCHLPVGISDG
jgi:hypothetical protein